MADGCTMFLPSALGNRNSISVSESCSKIIKDLYSVEDKALGYMKQFNNVI